MTSELVSAPRRRTAVSIAITGVLVAGMAGGWGLRTMLAPAADVLESPGYTLVTAEQGTVGQSVRLNASAQWSPETVVANQAAGTITSIELDSGAEVKAGEGVYTVDLRPVVVAEGVVPAFRDLGSGAEGEDVTQLQELLLAAGYELGEADGRFGAVVEWAVRAWQRELGVEPDGVVRRGDIVFVPGLPARLAIDPELAVGSSLGGGEPAVQVLPDRPRFTITLPEGQARLVSPGMAVEIPRDDGEPWRAEITDVRQPAEEGGAPVAVLAGVDGTPVCRGDCDQVPVEREVLLPSLIRVVPERSGVTVPAAALVTTAAGQTAVVLNSGELRPVDIVASASGLSVVEGVEVGEQVRTPGEIPAAADPDRR